LQRWQIVKAAVEIRNGSRNQLVLGSLDAQVDWGYAPDYVDAMWRILQLDFGDDFVIASGIRHSVREFASAAFEAVGLQWERWVVEDPQSLAFERPRAILAGNSDKLRRMTGWCPQVSFEQMVGIMVEAELENARREVAATGRPLRGPDTATPTSVTN
jgi:GDPmannose 4,6-dehydratase